MNILHVAEYYFANPDFARLGRELANRNHRVSVVTSIRSVDKPEKARDVEVFEINPFVTLYTLPHTLTLAPSFIYKTVKEQDIEIMHLLNDLSTNAAFASLVSRLVDIPYVYTIQGPGTRLGSPFVDTIIWAYHHAVERWIVKRARKIILLSRSLISAAEELGVEKRRMTVVSSGIDTLQFDAERPEVKERAQRLRDELGLSDSLVLGYVGRLAPVKGLGVLFSAVEKIKDKHRNIAILIIGDGAMRKDLEQLARKLNVNTIFAGWKQDTISYYSLMDVFVLPSFSEGLANVLLEAMAMEKAVVASKVGGNPDVIEDGENGFLVPAGDSKKMASVLSQLIEDDSLRARMGASNRQKIEKSFSWTTTLEKIERVYKEAL